MWTEIQAKALKDVFDALNKSGIPWLVLRNYEGLPWEKRAKDIDIAVKKKDFLEAFRSVSKSLKEHQFSLFTYTRFQYAWCFTFFNIENIHPQSIKIDILMPFTWKGAEIIEFNELYANRVFYNDFYAPSKIYDSFMLWIKPLMTGGFVKDKYRNDILLVLKNYPEEFFLIVKKKIANKVFLKIKPLFESRKLDEIIKFKNKISYSAYLNCLKRRPLTTIFSTIDHFFKEIQRRLHRPKGTFIAILGPDGSGKSTVTEQLKNSLAALMLKDLNNIIILHHRPNILPNLKKLFKGKTYNNSEENFTSPHRAKPAGRMSSLLRLVYYWIDYVVGYWCFVRRNGIAGKIFIFDRYFYDFIVDPFRSRINLPDWIRYFFLKITPKPDISILLNCDSSTIYERKKELPKMEIERQLKIYNKLADRYTNFFRVDSSIPIDGIIDIIIRDYIKRVSKPIDTFFK